MVCLLCANDVNRSATIVPTLLLTLACCALAVLGTYAADPGWWSGRQAVMPQTVVTTNGVTTTNYVPNPYAVANQGQLKRFTVAAVNELNADLTNSGGAGPALSNLVTGWEQDYATNNYNTTNSPYAPYKPSDFQAVNVGQVKYIASLVYSQLSSAGYSGLYPSWLASSNAADVNAANLGQVKEAFDFDLSLTGPSALTASANTGGTVNLSWTQPSANTATSYTIEQQTVDGAWTNIATVSSSTSSYTVATLSPGETPKFQIVAQAGNNVSLAQTTPADAQLIAPSNVVSTAGANSGEIDVAWQNNATDATYVLISQSPDGVNWTPVSILPATATTYAATNLTVGQTYYFGVSAGNN